MGSSALLGLPAQPRSLSLCPECMASHGWADMGLHAVVRQLLPRGEKRGRNRTSSLINLKANRWGKLVESIHNSSKPKFDCLLIRFYPAFITLLLYLFILFISRLYYSWIIPNDAFLVLPQIVTLFPPHIPKIMIIF